jgi:putative GTP pyrophosphokinase
MNTDVLRKEYTQRYETALVQLAGAIQVQLTDYLSETPRIDRIGARAKTVDKFLAKARNKDDTGAPKYEEPLDQIQDQVGARIIVFYLSDVENVARVIERYYHHVESRLVVPDSQWKFGYFGRHFILLMPKGLSRPGVSKEHVPQFFELQIKTLFQHAWSEANHDLGYKPTGIPPDPDFERQLAFTSAQSWGADKIFDELHRSRSGQ